MKTKNRFDIKLTHKKHFAEVELSLIKVYIHTYKNMHIYTKAMT